MKRSSSGLIAFVSRLPWSAWVGMILLGVLVGVLTHVSNRTIDQKMGWSKPGPQIAAWSNTLPQFSIDGQWRDNSRANVRLWEAAKLVNKGEHLPTFFQEENDCTANAVVNGIDYAQCVQISQGDEIEYKEIDRPWVYGGARVTIGKKRNPGPGTSGGEAWKFVQDYGACPTDAPNMPKYSGQRAYLWGQKGPPQQFFEFAAPYAVKTVALVRDADEVRDAICSGYPCTVSSNWGSWNNGRSPRKVDGRLVLDHNGSWSHSMVIIGYDGETGREPYFYVLNSWGENAHGTPLQGEPPGGFWVRKKDVDFMCRSGDCYAASCFAGFPARKLNFEFLVQRKGQPCLKNDSQRFVLAP